MKKRRKGKGEKNRAGKGGKYLERENIWSAEEKKKQRRKKRKIF